MSILKRFILLSFILLMLPSFTANTQSDGKVYAVLFFSPSCSHCHQVILEDLPPIREQFGDDLVVFMVDVTTESGQMMAQSAYQHYSIPPGNRGVPMMIIDEQILVGSIQIPTQLPVITEVGLLNGGIPVPQFPVMQIAYQEWVAQNNAAQPVDAPAETLETTPVESISPFNAIWEHDPVASVITIMILVGLIISVIGIGVTREGGFPIFVPRLIVVLSTIVVSLLTVSILLASETNAMALVVIGVTFFGLLMVSGLAVFGNRIQTAVVILTVVGLALSAYMAYIEMTANPAVCGVIGDCNAVQQSEYAFIMGIPVGVLGLLGYTLMLGISLIIIVAPQAFRYRFVVMLQTVVVLAGLFTIYLTFLEPFVIGAVCAWCLLSSLVVINLMWLVLPMVKTESEIVTEYLMYQPQPA